MINSGNPKEYPFPQAMGSSKVEVLVLCTDGSLHLIKSERCKEPSISVLVERPVKNPNETICAVAPISSLPSMVLLFIWDGSVYIMDVTKSQIICELGPPPSYRLGNPWQPVFALSPEGQHVLIRGDKKDHAKYLSDDNRIFVFKFESYQLIKTSLSEAESSQPGSSEISNLTHQLPLDKRCEIFLQNRHDHGALGLRRTANGGYFKGVVKLYNNSNFYGSPTGLWELCRDLKNNKLKEIASYFHGYVVGRLKNSDNTEDYGPDYLFQQRKSSLLLEKEGHKKT